MAMPVRADRRFPDKRAGLGIEKGDYLLLNPEKKLMRAAAGPTRAYPTSC